MGVNMAATTAGSNRGIDDIKDLLTDLKSDWGDNFSRLLAMQATLTEQVSSVSKAAEKMSLTVYGNGKPGLTTCVSDITTRLNHLEKPKKWLDTLLTTVITLAVTAIFYLILSHGIIK